MICVVCPTPAADSPNKSRCRQKRDSRICLFHISLSIPNLKVALACIGVLRQLLDSLPTRIFFQAWRGSRSTKRGYVSLLLISAHKRVKIHFRKHHSVYRANLLLVDRLGENLLDRIPIDKDFTRLALLLLLVWEVISKAAYHTSWRGHR